MDSPDNKEGNGKGKSKWGRFLDRFKSEPQTPDPTKLSIEQMRLSQRQHAEQRLHMLLASKAKFLETGFDTPTNPRISEIEKTGTINEVPVEIVEGKLNKTDYADTQFEIPDDQSLLQILKANQDEVNRIGRTHRNLFSPLSEAFYSFHEGLLRAEMDGKKVDSVEFSFGDRNYQVRQGELKRGFTSSPLVQEEGGKWSEMTNQSGPLIIKNLETQEELTFTPIEAHLIRDVGLYIGSAPSEIANFFPLEAETIK